MRYLRRYSKFGTRLVSVLATVALTVSMVPAAAFAQETAGAASGEIGFSALSTQSAADEAAAAAQDEAAYVDGEILVTFKGAPSALGMALSIASVPDADAEATIGALDLSAIESAAGEPVVVKLDDGVDEEQAVREAEELPNVASAQLNYRYYLEDFTPDAKMALRSSVRTQATDALTNDPALASYDPENDENAWHLNAIDIASAWDQVKCDGTVTVAVLDTGCDMSHEDLKDNVLADYAWNAYKGESLSCDYYGHGTHVAGCIAAAANNGTGTAGSSYNAKILPINVFDAYGSDQWSSTTKALITAYDYLFEFDDRHPELNLHVVNMSLGGYGTASADDLALQQRIAAARERDIISVCAGGNGVNGVSQTAGHYPSDYDESFAVTALSKDGYSPTTWCDRNAAKDICVPGEDIYSTVPLYCKMEGNANWWAYAPTSGTSMATPIAAGVFALLWAARPDLTVDEAFAAVKETASNRLVFPSDDWYMDRMTSDYGAGILSAGNAVAYVKKLPPNENTRTAVAEAAQAATDALAQVRVSANGADVPASLTWVPKAVYDKLSAAAATARNAAAASSSYDEVAAARDALLSAQTVFDAAVSAGTLKLATVSAKADLRRLARNSTVDTNGIIVSTDGNEVAAGKQWVATALSKRLTAAIDTGLALAADEYAGAAAVSAAATELTAARAAYNAGIKTKAAAAPAAKSITVNKATVAASAFKSVKNSATKATLGAKVKKIKAGALASTKVKTLVVRTKKLTKKTVKNALKGSKVTKVVVKVGTAKQNKQYVKKYKKIFTKKICGKKVTVKA